MSKKSKEEMLEEMRGSIWGGNLSEKDSWEEIKEAYDHFRETMSDDSDMFPNGRDYDAEDEDGPC